MDSEKLKQFFIPIMLLLVLVVGIYIVGGKVVGVANNYNSVRQDLEAKETTLKDNQTKLDNYKKKIQEEQQKEKESEKNEKAFYKPIESGLEPESVIAGEFSEILQLVRANKIKVRSIKYDYEPQDDNFYLKAQDKYTVARLNMEMISSYADYDNFLKEIYKHDHFLDIQSAEIVPYKKNKRILLINFKLTLYAKK